MKIDIAKIDIENRDIAVKCIVENWGSSLIVSRGRIHHAEELPGFIALVGGKVKGIITYYIDGSSCEIVSLDSMQENCGIGTLLIKQIEDIAILRGCKRVWLVTTNDNVHAIRFYQKRGFDMVSVHRNAITESRKLKPQIPFSGFDDIPILHEIEFEKLYP